MHEDKYISEARFENISKRFETIFGKNHHHTLDVKLEMKPFVQSNE
jgi:hypothetical protein